MGFTLLDDEPDKGFRLLDEPEAPKAAKRALGPPEDLTFAEKLVSGVTLPKWMDNLRGAAPYRVMQGMADPVVGAVQLGANLIGQGDKVNAAVKEQNDRYEAARAARGSDGTDVARVVGNIASPTNLVMAARLPAVATVAGRAGQGAAVGGATAAMAPIHDTSGGYAGTKAGQVATGAVTGAVLTPALGAVADKAAKMIGFGRPSARASVNDVDVSISKALDEVGQSIDDVPPDQLAALRTQVAEALQGGQKLDASAALRKADFEALRTRGTAGQITRDPNQFAREVRLAAVEDVGAPLANTFNEQALAVGTKLGGFAEGARNPYRAGTAISESLKATDDKLAKHVSGLYGEARAAAGRELDIPLQGFAQDYAEILGRYSPNVRNSLPLEAFEGLGLSGGVQRKVFNFEEADKLLKTINANKSNDPAVQSALGELRGALRRAVEGADAGGGPYRPAVNAAAERFKMHDAIPALKAAADGSVAPDDFVARFIINGKTNDVRGLAQTLKASDPAAFQEARAQIGDTLRRAAFGENPAGDAAAAFAPQRYMQALRRLGVDKLQAFFSPEEVADLMRVGRVMGYAKQAPAGAATNPPNTAGALISLASRIPGVSPLVSIGNAAAGAVKNDATVRRALAAQVPSSDLPLDDATRNYIDYLLRVGAIGAGGVAGAVGQ